MQFAVMIFNRLDWMSGYQACTKFFAKPLPPLPVQFRADSAERHSCGRSLRVCAYGIIDRHGSLSLFLSRDKFLVTVCRFESFANTRERGKCNWYSCILRDTFGGKEKWCTFPDSSLGSLSVYLARSRLFFNNCATASRRNLFPTFS